jgi:hypothetical protein
VSALELADQIRATATGYTWPVLVVDEDDPKRDEYMTTETTVQVVPPGSEGMVGALNRAVAEYALGDGTAVAFMGDDHRPRTPGWDTAYLDALNQFGTGLVYGNDLIHGAALPTQVAMTADIPRALGFMAPPALGHLYVDNFWHELGSTLDRMRYLPGVIVEHMHPLVGKAPDDDGYRRVNAPERVEADRLAFERYMHGQFTEDVAKVRKVMAPRG